MTRHRQVFSEILFFFLFFKVRIIKAAGGFPCALLLHGVLFVLFVLFVMVLTGHAYRPAAS